MAASQETAKVQQWKETGITVPLGTTGTIQTITVPHGAEVCTIEVYNADGTNTFDAFNVAIKVTDSGNFVTHASAAGDFTSPVLPMRYASASPVLLAKETSVVLQYDCRGLDQIRLQASNDTAAGSAEVYFHFN